jgi:hypothetical protein
MGYDNLAGSPSDGQLPQAIARKNARRGGTPNAPEVDDEPAPAASGPTGVSGVQAPSSGMYNDAMAQGPATLRDAATLGAQRVGGAVQDLGGAVNTVGRGVRSVGAAANGVLDQVRNIGANGNALAGPSPDLPAGAPSTPPAVQAAPAAPSLASRPVPLGIPGNPPGVQPQIPGTLPQSGPRVAATPMVPAPSANTAPPAPGYGSNMPTLAGPAGVGQYLPGAGAARDAASEVSSAYRSGGVPAAIGAGVRGLGATVIDTARDVAGGVARVAQPAIDAVRSAFTGDYSRPGSAPAPAAAAAPAPSTPGKYDNDLPPGAPPAAQGPTLSVPVPTPNPLAGMLPQQTDAERNNAPFHEAYQAMQGRGRFEDAQAAQAAQSARIRNGAPDSRDLERAQGEARVARFRATNGADMILRGGNAAQKAAIVGEANAADRNVLAIQGEQARANEKGNARDFVKENVEGEGSLIAQQNARTAAADAPYKRAGSIAKVGLAAAQTQQAQLSVQGVQKLQALQDQLAKAAPGSPEHEQLLSAILAAQGKEKPAAYQLAHLKGGTDPNNPLAQLPDQAYMVDQRSGKFQRVDTAPPAAKADAATIPAMSEADYMAAARAHPENRGFDDAYLKNQYAAALKAGKVKAP